MTSLLGILSLTELSAALLNMPDTICFAQNTSGQLSSGGILQGIADVVMLAPRTMGKCSGGKDRPKLACLVRENAVLAVSVAAGLKL
nr:hypothetical protein [Citrobacter portucalensis]